MRSTPSRPFRQALRVLATTAVAVVVLLPTAAHAAVPTAPVRLPAGIEGFATYQKQTVCSPTAKPGTVKLKNLLLRTYPSSRSLGISRSCSAGGTSEHKEGRAFDWGVRVTSTTERAAASSFLTWLMKTDAKGNKAANARRLGVMYVIWNKRIWGAYAANSGWRTYNGSNPHTDHVHISLSRAGGAGTTSFWTGKVNNTSTTALPGTADSSGRIYVAGTSIVSVPKPLATLPQTSVRLADESFVVQPNLAGAWSRTALVKGQQYRVEVRGTYRWNKVAGSLADAECSDMPHSDWQAWRWLANARGDQLGLYLDGRDLPLRSYGGSECATSSHTYVTTITATRTGRALLRLWEPAPRASYADNSGALRVRIIHDTPRDALTVPVDMRDRWGTTTPGSVVAGQRYTVTATGTWSPSTGTTADAVCVTNADGEQEQPRDSDGQRLWRMRLDGVSLKAWCNPDHTYSWTFTPERSGPVVVQLDDQEDQSDNAGRVRVTLTRATEQESTG